MPDTTTFFAFALVALGMVLTPGPNMIYLVSRSICQGRMAGMISLGGVALAFLFYAVSAALGITALLLAVPVAYDVLRFAGVIYLLWLAWQTVKPRWPLAVPGPRSAARQPREAVRDGRRYQPPQPEGRGDVPVAAAAVHLAGAWQRADTVAAGFRRCRSRSAFPSTR